MAENNTLIAHFPRSAMGYAPASVDEFVRQIGERLEEMQVVCDRVDQLTEQNEQLQRQNAELTAGNEQLYRQLTEAQTALESAKSSATVQKDDDQAGPREVALANAMLAIERRRIAVDVEIEGLRDQAKRDVDALKESARRESEGLKKTAMKEAEGLRATAEEESTQIISQAKRAAEQMIDETVAAASLEEERLQTLCAQYEQTVEEVRRVFEQQLAMLPASGSPNTDSRLPRGQGFASEAQPLAMDDNMASAA